ncbi:MAG: hypothetical protein ACXWQQ_15000 [Pseudobdellovibrio sp.]
MKKIVLWFFSILLPLSFLIYWKAENKIYPTNDESFYFNLTQELYTNFQIHDFPTALKELYFHKHWKPILHPVIGVGFLFLSQGDSRLAINLFDTCFYLLLLSICYLYLARYVPPLGTAVGTILIGFIPWVFGTTTNFNSEIAFLASVAAFFYFSHDLSGFKDTKKLLLSAFCLSLMACLRPIESGLLFSLPILSFVILSIKDKKINYIDLVPLALWIAIFAGVIIPPYFVYKSDWSHNTAFLIDICCLLLFLGILNLGKLYLNRGFQIFFGIVFCIVIIWYASGAKELFDWIIMANFDTMAKETGHRYGRPLSEFIYFYLTKFGLIPLGLAVLGILNWKTNIKSYCNFKNLFFLCSLFLLPLTAGALSYNGDVRYYYGAWVIFILIALKIVLNRSHKYYFFRLYSVATLALVLYLNLINLNFRLVNNPVADRISSYLGQSFFNLIYNPRDYSTGAYEKMIPLIDPKINSPRIYYIRKNTDSYADDPWALMIIGREKGFYFEIQSLDLYLTNKKQDIINEINKDYNYVIAGPVQEDWSDAKTGIAELGATFVSVCRDSTKESPLLNFGKFEYIGSFNANIVNDRYAGYCVFKNLNGPVREQNLFH